GDGWCGAGWRGGVGAPASMAGPVAVRSTQFGGGLCIPLRSAREESGMEIRLASLLRGAQEAEGTAIIIDVFRAFTTAAVAFDRGAEQIVLVAEVEEALALRRRGVGHLCLGEVDGKRPPGFDFGNSP